jgi:hypothetical protein
MALTSLVCLHCTQIKDTSEAPVNNLQWR